MGSGFTVRSYVSFCRREFRGETLHGPEGRNLRVSVLPSSTASAPKSRSVGPLEGRDAGHGTRHFTSVRILECVSVPATPTGTHKMGRESEDRLLYSPTLYVGRERGVDTGTVPSSRVWSRIVTRQVSVCRTMSVHTSIKVKFFLE